MSQRPVAIGLLLCEQLIVEVGTKNVTPVNCFTQRTGAAFPWMSPQFVVVAWVTDGSGEISLQVVFENAETFAELHSRTMPFRFAAPLQQLRLSVRLNSIVFPNPGPYRVTLLADGEIIAQRKFFVVPKETYHE